MDESGPSTYGDHIAEIYDQWHSVPADTGDTVEFLVALGGKGPSLELGIGTGRIALPLAARGLEVHGIDASDSMVAKLREKPGGTGIPVTIGNFAEVAVEGEYSLVFVVFNTFFALLSQDEQVRCFRNVAGHLTDGGVFVIEAFVPDLARFDRKQRTQASRIDVDRVILDVSMHDAMNQRVDAQQVVIREDDIKLYPVRIRYAWLSELDLMAQLAGLRLRERWGGWRREPFTSESTRHVSVYEQATD